MSKKTEKRIKRLRKNSIWPQIIETFIVEVAFIVAVVIVLVVDFSSETHDLVVNGANACKSIVSYVNKEWDSSTNTLGTEAQQEFSTIVKYDNEIISAINIVDDDFNVLAAFGDSDINDSSYPRYFDRSLFDKNGFYFTEQASTYDVVEKDSDSSDDGPNVGMVVDEVKDGTVATVFIDDNEIEAFRIFKKHFFNSFDSFNDKQFYNWATTKDSWYSMWIVYKTNFTFIAKY